MALPGILLSDLVLLKLYAGGPQDLSDIRQLLETPEGERIASEVDAHIGELAAEYGQLWHRVRTTEN